MTAQNLRAESKAHSESNFTTSRTMTQYNRKNNNPVKWTRYEHEVNFSKIIEYCGKATCWDPTTRR